MRLFAVAAAAAAILAAGPAAAQPADINCTIQKAYRCNLQGCEVVPLAIGLRFNLGSKQGCMTKGGQCDGNLPVESSETVGGDVIVRFKSNGMVLRINIQAGNMVGGDAGKNNQAFAYGGMCKA